MAQRPTSSRYTSSARWPEAGRSSKKLILAAEFSNSLLERADMSLDVGHFAVGTVHEAPELTVIEAGNVSIPWTRCRDVSTATAIMDISSAYGCPMGRPPVHRRSRRPCPEAPVTGG